MTETDAETNRTETETGRRDRWSWLRRGWRKDRVDRRLREAEETQRLRDAATAAANRRETSVMAYETDTDLAPVPRGLRWLGIWADRTIGTIPLVAPLVVSGTFTAQVFTDAPLDAALWLAVSVTAALEGGLWKLVRLYEKTLVAGDSTIALRLGIGVYLSLISGLIYWHAHQHGADWRPALGVAVMSGLGVFIWSRTARWQRRRELRAAGRVDRQAPKFAFLAWLLCPIETPTALRHAVKYRIESPIEAIADRRLFKAAGKPKIWPPLAEETGTGGDVPEVTGGTSEPPDETSRPNGHGGPSRANKTTRNGRGKTGRDRLRAVRSDEEYVAMVRDRYRDWADPNRRRTTDGSVGPVSAGEVMAATGLVGKPVALRIQRLLYGQPTTKTNSPETDPDDKEPSRELVTA